MLFIEILRDSAYYQRLKFALKLLLAIHLVGTLGYLIISASHDLHTTVIDALYMTFITVATIGYGEIIDLSSSPIGRLFTMVIGFGGIGITTYLFSTVTAFVIETNLTHAYRRRRMERTISELSDHYIVCGIGRIGSYVADELIKTDRPFVVIEESKKAIANHNERTQHFLNFEGDASDDELLLRAGVKRCKGVFAVTGDDGKNLVISLSARQLCPNARIVARVHDPRNADKTRRAGADEIVSPDFTGGMRLASVMLRPHAVNFMDMMLHTENNLRVEEVVVPDGFVSRSVASLGMDHGWMLVAIRTGDQWEFNPRAEVPITAGQVLISIVSPEGRKQLEAAVALAA